MSCRDSVQRAGGAARAAVDDVGVDHRCRHVGMPQQFLHGADVRSGLEQVGGKAVSERVRVDQLVDACLLGCDLHRPLDVALAPVVAPHAAAARVGAVGRCGEDVLPGPFGCCARILAGDGVWHFDIGVAGRQVDVVPAAAFVDVLDQVFHHAARKHGHAVFVALAFSDGDQTPREIDVLNA